ncbi:MAG TPA: ABC transporter permease [Parafilimonas sp.]|nr:ABC transporter permease [Parafilimonas sp.]
MFNNFFKTAFRNITRHKGFSFINIAGLTLGLTACILIGLFVWDEHQYDKNIKDGEQVYRVYDEYTNTEGTQMMAVTPPMFATTLDRDFPEVEKTARVMMMAEYKTLFEAGKNKLYEQSGYFVDSTFLDIFPLSLKYGRIAKALNDPNSIVISQEMAERFFGSDDPVGKQILKDKQPYTVKAVFEKDPKFHLQFNYLISLSAVGLPAERMQSWGWHQFVTYVKLKKQTDVQALQSKFQTYVKKKSTFAENNGTIGSDIPFFQSLKDIHLYSSDFKFDLAQRGNITYVNALSIIAIFILLIACFNFINLSTAKSLQRAKEVGVRKAVGAGKKQLVFQFTGETILLVFISIVISVALAIVFLPWLNSFTNKNIPSLLFINPVVILLFIALALTVGILAGFYPALVLSGFKPVKVLKASLSASEEPGKMPWLRHGLVITQFTLSILLIISAIIVFNQVNYLHNKDLGFNKEQIMFFPMRGDNMFNNTEAFKNDLLKVPGVSSVSIGYGYPGDAVAGDEIIVPRNGKQTTLSATQLTVDHDYIKTLGLQIIAGRDFSKAMNTDKDHAWIINETAVKQMGFGTPQKALGQDLYWHPWGASNPDSLKTGKIIGVVKDFNYKSLYDKVETTVIQIFPGAAWKVAVKINTANMSNTINAIRNAWNKFTPDYPIEYKFLDENFQQMYTAEDKLRSLLWIFTGIAIFIGCLGLFGLAAYTAERRKKEVGIRKVLGASTESVVVLLSRDFMVLVVISLVIASPVAWILMHQWLQNFAYRVHIDSWVFVIAAIVSLSIAFITVSFQAIKAAVANPVKSLRTE